MLFSMDNICDEHVYDSLVPSCTAKYFLWITSRVALEGPLYLRTHCSWIKIEEERGENKAQHSAGFKLTTS